MIFALLMNAAIPFTAFTVLVLGGPPDMFWELFKDTMFTQASNSKRDLHFEDFW